MSYNFAMVYCLVTRKCIDTKIYIVLWFVPFLSVCSAFVLQHHKC